MNPEAPTTEDFQAWIQAFMQTDDRPKIMLCGPRFYSFITDAFDPATPHFYRGSAQQRRKERRYRARMWQIIGSAKEWAKKQRAEELTRDLGKHPLFRDYVIEEDGLPLP